ARFCPSVPTWPGALRRRGPSSCRSGSRTTASAALLQIPAYKSRARGRRLSEISAEEPGDSKPDDRTREAAGRRRSGRRFDARPVTSDIGDDKAALRRARVRPAAVPSLAEATRARTLQPWTLGQPRLFR